MNSVHFFQPGQFAVGHGANNPYAGYPQAGGYPGQPGAYPPPGQPGYPNPGTTGYPNPGVQPYTGLLFRLKNTD